MFVNDATLDAALDYIANNADRIVLCSQEPATFAAAGTYKLADAAVVAGEFTKANGDVSGRKTTLAQQTGDTVDATGTATHWALVDDTDSELLITGALLASQALTATNPFVINAVDVLEIKDPT